MQVNPTTLAFHLNITDHQKSFYCFHMEAEWEQFNISRLPALYALFPFGYCIYTSMMVILLNLINKLLHLLLYFFILNYASMMIIFFRDGSLEIR